MPHYMRATTCIDRMRGCYNVVVHWQDDDPNRLVCQTDAGSMPTGHQYDPAGWYITDDEIDHALATMGFRVVGSEAPALMRGQRVVIRDGGHTFFNPADRGWYSCNPNTDQD